MATTTENGIVREAWRTAVCAAAAQAREKYRSQEDTIDLAEQLVLAGEVQWHEDRAATVTSQSDPTTSYTVKGEKCTCQQATFRPHEFCKHVFATLIYRKAYAQTKAHVEEVTSDPGAGAGVGDARRATGPPIAEEFLYEMHGVKAVLFGGLLHLAHQRGLQALTVEVVSVTETLAVMRATVTFTDGLTWSDVGDASPQNVGSRIKPHFIRMASTRAMARCLRNALDIPYVCTVELSEEEGSHHA